ncbi:MAG: Ig-like domain-containing protein [Brevinematales bacterium]|nr:Ig-like domain-containing protein [Brevinematales bacterium]
MKNLSQYYILVFLLTSIMVTVSNCTRLTDLIPIRISDNTVSLLPTVSVLSPTNMQIFHTNSIVVSGTASDDSGIKEVRLRVGDSGEFGVVDGSDSWRTNLVGLNEGTNEIYFFAVSVSGEHSMTNVVYFVIDVTPPVVLVTNLTNGQVFAVSSVLVLGTASDNLGIKEVRLRVGDSGEFGVVDGSNSWRTNLSNLEEGTNTMYVFVVDKAGLTNWTTNNFVIIPNVYVSTTGNDANLGVFRTLPVRTIRRAIEIANQYSISNILIATGTYTPGNGLNSSGFGVVITNNNLRLIGGWNVGFSSRSGYSILNGQNSLNHIIFSTNVSGILIDGFIITGGFANGTLDQDKVGAGIYFSNVSYSTVSNSIIGTNGALSKGGGIYIESSYSNVIRSRIVSNTASYGGGIYLTNSYGNVIDSLVSFNYSSFNGGGVYFDGSMSNLISNLILSNVAAGGNLEDGGGGLYFSSSHHNVVVAEIISNRVIGSNGRGGGMRLQTSHSNIINSSFKYNSAVNNSGGLYLKSSTLNLISGEFVSNTGQNGSAVYLDNSLSNLVSSVFLGNAANNFGTVYFFLSHYNVVSNSIILQNTANNTSGVYLINSVSNIFYSSSFGNASGDTGGIFARNVTNLLIVNSVFTNCGQNKVINLENVSGLFISNNLIGGSSSGTTIGIYETSDISGHTLYGNVFVTNTLKAIYREASSGMEINNINWVNDPVVIGASISTNNRVTNI